ncbi:MAG: type IV pilin [Thermoplasmata archaeon]|nr:type IV pilin [Thermoplasmata archaeon]
MRSFRRDVRAISEVVGALMLVLIVVVAATSLAIFVASYQKQLQAERAVTQERSLEHLTIIHATPTLSSGGTNWSVLNFSLASLYINPSTVTEITLNDQPLRQYSAWTLDLASGTFVAIVVGPGGQLSLTPREQVNVVVDFNASSTNFSFYDPSFVLHTTDYVKIDVFTQLLNDFNRVFIPPTAIALVTPLQTLNGSNFTTIPILDGTQSFATANTSIVSWAWQVTPDNVNVSGEKAVATFNGSISLHTILLVVTDNDGLIGTDTIFYRSS